MPGIMSDDGDFLMTSLTHVRSSSPPGRQSLLTAMNNFVNAVDEMDGAVMIPCKLQDMHLEEDGGGSDSASVASDCELSSGCPSTPPHDGGMWSNGHSNALMTIPEGKALPAPGQQKGADLYTYYGMLRAIKAELVRGPSQNPEDEEDLVGSDGEQAEEGDLAKQTATMFRHHLRGLFGVLRQMTSTADRLTERYQTEIGDSSLSSNRSLAHYTI